jgi:hypothetical protein
MKKQNLIGLAVLFVLVVAASTTLAAGGDRHELAAILRATTQYRNLDTALADGYEALFDCTVNPSDPSEAMGQHYINNALVDDVLELDKPEVLMYEALPNGRMRLIGVEYIIFEDVWSGDEAPEFLGQTMARKTAVGVHPVPPFYEVHAWVWRHNPNGMIADWNPEVSCD